MVLGIICGGLVGCNMGKEGKSGTGENAPTPPPATDKSRHKLTGIVTFADPIKHQITIKHNGVPGVLEEGENLFAVNPHIEIPKPSEAVGQNVEVEIGPIRDQWAVIDITRKKQSVK
jgi:hypothetical protein